MRTYLQAAVFFLAVAGLFESCNIPVVPLNAKKPDGYDYALCEQLAFRLSMRMPVSAREQDICFAGGSPKVDAECETELDHYRIRLDEAMNRNGRLAARFQGVDDLGEACDCKSEHDKAVFDLDAERSLNRQLMSRLPEAQRPHAN